MPKGSKGYEDQSDGGYSKYDPSNAPVKKNGGNKSIHDPDAQKDGYAGEKYPKPNATGKGKTE